MGSITISTSELIGCIADTLPIVQDEKSQLYGIAIEWQPISASVGDLTLTTDDMSLRFTAYDVRAGATVEWVPGEGAEGEVQEDKNGDPIDDDIEWGGDADPFRVFIRGEHCKEIVKLFKLPVKLWRFPVSLKVNLSQSKLVIERQDGPRGERFLTVPTDNDMLKQIPDVYALATAEDTTPTWAAPDDPPLNYSNARYAALGAVRFHGAMRFIPNVIDEPTQIWMGSRYHAILYREGAEVHRHNLLRDGAGAVTGRV